MHVASKHGNNLPRKPTWRFAEDTGGWLLLSVTVRCGHSSETLLCRSLVDGASISLHLLARHCWFQTSCGRCGRFCAGEHALMPAGRGPSPHFWLQSSRPHLPATSCRPRGNTVSAYCGVAAGATSHIILRTTPRRTTLFQVHAIYVAMAMASETHPKQRQTDSCHCCAGALPAIQI